MLRPPFPKSGRCVSGYPSSKRHSNADNDYAITPDKEVEDYYRHGLKVPDHVTLMWSDDK